MTTTPHVYADLKHFYPGDVVKSTMNGNTYEVVYGCQGIVLACLNLPSDERFAIVPGTAKFLTQVKKRDQRLNPWVQRTLAK